MSENVVFEITDLSDLEELVDMRMKFLLDMHPTNDKTVIEKAYKENMKYLEEMIKQELYIGYLGSINGLNVCCGGLLLYKLPPLINKFNRVQGHVLNIYTIPEYRNQGIGLQLIEYIKTSAKETGINRLFLNSTVIGEGLYKKCGFKEPEEKAMILEL